MKAEMRNLSTGDVASLFTETDLIRKKKRRELLAKAVFGSMALAMIIPLLIIIGYLFQKAWPLLSWDFLVNNPHNPYIVMNDLPKVQQLEQLYPNVYRDRPVTVYALSADR